ncbi:unnamed protein product [marine sediment metagenome]|uniref:Uncharacterized protein n=1 Tax=marine sediment metagenome TaxID=412755 RepID=X0VB77_9ZZZZ
MITDGTTEAGIDSKLGALCVIQGEHHEVHEGEFFTLSHFYSDVADNGNADLHIIVGAGKELHVTITVVGEANAEVLIYEGTTYNAAGTAEPIHDKNRVTANTSNALAKHTPTINTLGTVRHHSFLPGGTKKAAIGSVRSNGQEWIFKKSVDYLIRITNRGGADKDFSIEIEFYEV